MATMTEGYDVERKLKILQCGDACYFIFSF